MYIFIGLFWLCGLFVTAWAFSGCSEWGNPLAAVRSLLTAVASLAMDMGLGHVGFTSCGPWALQHRLTIVAQGLRCAVACGILLDQGLISVSCIDRWTLTTEARGKTKALLLRLSPTT